MLAADSRNPLTMNSSSTVETGRSCDFCGEVVRAVRRVALDREYDRLQKAHREQYACDACFEAKEQLRLGLTPREARGGRDRR